jgi:hypothetical protein
MAAPKNPALTHSMRPPDVGRAAGHAAANDQDIAVHDFGFRPSHCISAGSRRSASWLVPPWVFAATPRHGMEAKFSIGVLPPGFAIVTRSITWL